MNYIVAGDTDVGIVKETNQDSYGARVINTSIGKMVFVILCDGMGGLAKGEVASATIVNAFFRWTEERLPALSLSYQVIPDEVIRGEWTRLVVDYNEKIKEYGRNHNINLGTTVTAVLLTEQRYYVINIGDTRAYELYGDIRMITRDQTVVAREVDLGIITAEQAKTDPRRNVLLQCVGASDTVVPDFFFGQTIQNAVYLLCCDGFRHEITNQEIFQYLQPNAMTDVNTMQTNIKMLIEINKQRQERDNITAIAVRTY